MSRKNLVNVRNRLTVIDGALDRTERDLVDLATFARRKERRLWAINTHAEIHELRLKLDAIRRSIRGGRRHGK